MDASFAVLGVSPFEVPDVPLVAALVRAGCVGVLDLGHHREAWQRALAALAVARTPYGIRIPERSDVSTLTLTDQVTCVITPGSEERFAWLRSGQGGHRRRVFIQVSTLEEAKRAAQAGFRDLIVKGHEAAGQVGDETCFVLLQRVLSELDVRVWAQGGIGLHTAAAAIAVGASGVVLDSQLALLDEASTGAPLRQALSAFDGSETKCVHGYRLYARPGALPAHVSNEPSSSAALTRQLGAHDPAQQLITLGQDACFARVFAERFGSVARLVSGLRTAITGHLRQARALTPLARHSPLAAALGTEYPIAQGPMTRVSDSADFAEAVAEEGALPFLALAMMRGPEVAALLDETRTKLGDRPWGVGVLGFLPPELRQEQLEQVCRARPRFALVAGGRPSQLAPLTAAGITAFLHVPSVGLLDAFLRDGARHFVFEGRECGGHVGPRSSFVLWETAVSRLAAQEHLQDLHLLFAGGIHDARSAAAVAALAAPLIARGAKIGVLVGTAYLFTYEAVERRAIGRVFQEAALTCASTTLVETGPGHATRCAPSQFVSLFEGERARLRAAGLDAQAVWAELEQFNLGRLRAAAKGRWRVGGELVAVSEDEQRREGMFMLGQVAALRTKRCRIAELHEDLSLHATAWLAAQGSADVPGVAAPAAEPIAIIGAACIFAGAPDLERYWSHSVYGYDAVREVPRERWDTAVHYDPEGSGDKVPSRWGAFVEPTLFDPVPYGIPPRSLAAVDPAQLLALEVAQRALNDAGLAERSFDRERVGVIFGAEAGSDLGNAHAFRSGFTSYVSTPLPAALDASLPRLTEDSFPGLLSNVISGRIANRLDLRGPNYTVDAACASSLAAVAAACKELQTHACDVVVAGAVDLHNSLQDFMMFASAHALSKTGLCRPFDSRADGTVLGEGVAALVLKRLSDAQRAGDRVYAVIASVGASSDGRSHGLTAPRKEGQMRALERAYTSGALSPCDVDLVEAHGTGTAVGDRTELASLMDYFVASGALPGTCTLGSIKAQIGHTKCAAGLAGLIKSALAIYHGVLPPASHVATPSLDEAGPFMLRNVAAPWLRARRVAGVSAFGFGGSNFHAVLHSAAQPPSTLPSVAVAEWPAELFIVRGKDAAQAETLLAALQRAAQSSRAPSLRELAATAAASHAAEPARYAFVANSHAQLLAQLTAALSAHPDPDVYRAGAPVDPGTVAWLFPGQGSQRPHMLADLFVVYPALRGLLELAPELAGALFPGGAYTASTRTAQQRAITDTQVAQPALGMVSLALARVLQRVAVPGAMFGGHSYGELVALRVAGACDDATLLALSRARAACIARAAAARPDVAGAMAAVHAPIERVRELLRELPGVVIANHNAPDQVVLSGLEPDLERAVTALSAIGVRCARVPVECAFHSPAVAAASATFAVALEAAQLRAPQYPVYANETAAPYGSSPSQVRAALASQLARPVRFVEQIEAMYAAGARVFLEVGPGQVLTSLVKRILQGREHTAIACVGAASGPGREVTALLHALAQLVAAGVDVQAGPLFEGRAQPLDLDASFEASATAWSVDGRGARPLHGELPDTALGSLAQRVELEAATSVGADEGTHTVREFLHNMRALAEAQRDVMLRQLGGAIASVELAPPSPAAAPPPAQRSDQSVLEILLTTVSQRTGYPSEMLDPTLDLEADLGIDSIKRLEIIEVLRERLPQRVQPEARDAWIEQLAGARTLAALAGLLEHAAPRADSVAPIRPVEPTAGDVERLVMEVRPAPAARAVAGLLEGRRFAIAADELGVAEHLTQLLNEHGAQTSMVSSAAPLTAADGFISLSHLGGEARATQDMARLFEHTQAAVRADAKWIIAVTGLGGRFGHHAHRARVTHDGCGVAGFFRSLAKERPDSRVCVIDLAPSEPPELLARQILAEIVADEPRLELGYADGERYEPAIVPSSASSAPAREVALDPSHVILITGGARGITAQVALALAQRYGCTLELVGRARLDPTLEDAELQAAQHELDLRRVLAARMNGAGRAGPAALDAAVRDVLTQREAHANLAAIRASGARVHYHALDVRDEAAFDALIDRLLASHGRIDGVIHGAGLIEDKLLVDKTRASFERVFDTKVRGAYTLARRLAADARFFVLFSSISGALGNRGQCDYAAANDALDKLAHRLHGEVRGRVLSINWGPWCGVGMVRPELEREYARRGIAMLTPEQGVRGFFDELLGHSDPQAMLVASSSRQARS